MTAAKHDQNILKNICSMFKHKIKPLAHDRKKSNCLSLARYLNLQKIETKSQFSEDVNSASSEGAY